MTRTLGYDPASTTAGLAVVEDGVPIYIGIWQPPRRIKDPLERIRNFDSFLQYLLSIYKPDRIAIEVIRVGTSHDTTRSLSRFETVAILQAFRNKIEILEFQVNQGRAAMFGEGYGTTSKEVVFQWMKKLYPNLPWLEQDKGGTDQSDALVPALAYDAIKARKSEITSQKRRRKKNKRATA